MFFFQPTANGKAITSAAVAELWNTSDQMAEGSKKNALLRVSRLFWVLGNRLTKSESIERS
ncbi:hypothetical protein [Paraburkholderia ultramafica]|uniref:hypothetical protein n=1 Tax=Paraburkholderia ultramafica TaxID=1544867 RepID=UPI0015836D3C|nr:hypothetical protein [Paraburkholderia ultramafica]